MTRLLLLQVFPVLLLCRVANVAAMLSVTPVAKLVAFDGEANDELGTSVATSGSVAVVGAPGDDSSTGAVYIFPWNDTVWSSGEKITASDAQTGDLFGAAVAIDVNGTVMAIGAKYQDTSGSNAGAVYIFRYNGSAWNQEVKLLASDGAVGDEFGFAVAISGDVVVVGAVEENEKGLQAGAAYIFRHNGSIWNQEAKLLASDGAILDQFGYSVGVSGDLVVVGARYEDDNGSNAGAAYTFHWDGSSWSQVCKVLASDGQAGDLFGSSVAVSGDSFVVGAPEEDQISFASGAAYVFLWDGATCSQVAKLVASDGQLSDNFGSSVTIYGDVVVIGAPTEDDNGSNAGAAYLFMWDGIAWTEQTKILSSDGQANDRFGSSVALSADIVVAGAFQQDEVGTNAGAAYVFEQGQLTQSPTSNPIQSASAAPTPSPLPLFIQKSKLVAFDGEQFDLFGSSVATSGNVIVIGAPLEDEADFEAGAAYVFNWDGTNWSMDAKLTASDAESSSQFGYAVDISGNVLVIGARLENERGTDAGAVYVFRRNGEVWQEEAKLTAADGEAVDHFGYSVGISGGVVVVGAPFEDEGGDSAGAAYIFAWDGSSWSQDAKLLADDADAFDQFGWSAAISGTSVVVGARQENGNGMFAGAAYVFTQSGTEWLQASKLLADDGNLFDLFGVSVAIDGDNIAVGAPSHDDTASAAGAVYVFTREGISWSQAAKLLADDGQSNDRLGSSVAISGDFVITGAPSEDDKGSIAGAAYAFFNDGTQWTQASKLLAEDGEEGDEFGFSVAIRGDVVVAGAFREDEMDNNAGAAYVFLLFNSTLPPISAATSSPTQIPTTSSPTQIPTTSSPTQVPTLKPTDEPTKGPTTSPSTSPTEVPTESPSTGPTAHPSDLPIASPTPAPIKSPTREPTMLPSASPTVSPIVSPTFDPTQAPFTMAPTTSVPTTSLSTDAPSEFPSTFPSESSFSPSLETTRSSSNVPSTFPSSEPSKSQDPTSCPSVPPAVVDSLVAVVKPMAALFHPYISSVNLCDGTIFCLVPTAEKCAYAASFLGINYNIVQAENNQDKPKGCYRTLKGRVFFNSHNTGSSGMDGDVIAMCQACA